MNEALCEQINRTIDRIELKDVMRKCEMKPTVYTDEITDYKIITLNDERIADRYATVMRVQGADLWRVILTFDDYERAKKSLVYLVELRELHIKQ